MVKGGPSAVRGEAQLGLIREVELQAVVAPGPHSDVPVALVAYERNCDRGVGPKARRAWMVCEQYVGELLVVGEKVTLDSGALVGGRGRC